MRKMLKTGATALMLTCMASDVLAAAGPAGCAAPADMVAVKAAAVQQRLMVAALSCDAIQLYNKFVGAYQRELQASDRALQRLFRRLNGRGGIANYHAFKTRLANASSMQSIGDIRGYCDSAKATFEAALAPKKSTLAVFVSGQKTSADDAFSPCQVRTAATAVPPVSVPRPQRKPASAVRQAQAGLTVSN
jgi:hypothetical protein